MINSQIENNTSNTNKSYPLQPRNTNTGKKRCVSCVLRKISKMRNIALPESVIEKLSAERVVERGEFEFLDSARLSEIGIKSKEDRIKVLKLVKMYNNKELLELRNSFDKAYTRSQLQAHFYAVHQQSLSLVIQMPDPEDRISHSNPLNCTYFFHGRVAASVTNEAMQCTTEAVTKSIRLIEEEKRLGSLFYRHEDTLLWKRKKAALVRGIAKYLEERYNE